MKYWGLQFACYPVSLEWWQSLPLWADAYRDKTFEPYKHYRLPQFPNERVIDGAMRVWTGMPDDGIEPRMMIVMHFVSEE